jgi:thioredoxin reductase (NADPH)
VNGQVELGDGGYIVADETTKTNLPGVFAIGDIRTKPLRQIVTAAADGATSSVFAEEYINELK